MPTRPDSPDPTGNTANPFAEMGNQMGAGLGFFQDWMKAAGSALPHVSGQAAAPGAVPGWGMPTLDPAELDKRIQELKTVQFWLEQNARMVAMTIQGLEVQRMTLATLQGMNVSMDTLKDALKVKPDAMQGFFKAASAAPRPEAAPGPAPGPAPAPSPAPRPSIFSWGQAPAPDANWSQGVPEQAPAAVPPKVSTAASLVDGGSDDVPAQAPDGAGSTATADAASPTDASAADLINPMRWWDTLTQQFSHLATQAAQTGMTPGGGTTAARAAQPTSKSTPKSAGKVAAKTAPQPTTASPTSKPGARSGKGRAG